MAEGRVLCIAGSDSGGGAGIQADIKAVTALGGYAASAITAITVQDTLGVHEIWPVPAQVVAAQARVVLADIGADVIKAGILGEAAAAVADLLDDWSEIPLVLDPVMTAKGGASLADPETVTLIKARLMPRAALVTPNAPEAAALSGVAVETTDDLRRAGDALLAAGCAAALLKGGHIPGRIVVDLLVTSAGETWFESVRQETRHTHGTGCALASAAAVGLAQGLELTEAVSRARSFVDEAIRHAPGYGAGAGPLDHGWPLRTR